jgi:site-specific DNA recombinase
MATAPMGYKNRINEDGKKYIAVNKPIADLIRWAFETLGTGHFNTEQVWKQARAKGLQFSKHGFWIMIRNPVYCGKIFIPKYKEEEAHFVQGQHKPIVSEALFYQVLDILDGRKQKQRAQIAVNDNFPLRGFLICPKCGQILTASTSKGCRKYYSYYHCTSACGWRHRARKGKCAFC